MAETPGLNNFRFRVRRECASKSPSTECFRQFAPVGPGSIRERRARWVGVIGGGSDAFRLQVQRNSFVTVVKCSTRYWRLV
jgi:hypothetical protein